MIDKILRWLLSSLLISNSGGRVNKFLKWLGSATTPNAAYQMCHVIFAALVIIVASQHFKLIYPCVWVFTFAVLKEGWFDPRYEDAATAGNGWEDFAFYMVGIALGVITHILLR